MTTFLITFCFLIVAPLIACWAMIALELIFKSIVFSLDFALKYFLPIIATILLVTFFASHI